MSKKLLISVFLCFFTFSSISVFSQEIVYSSKKGGTFDLWLINLDGTGDENLSVKNHDVQGLFNEVEPRWSPEGRKIAFISNKSGRYNVWIMDDNGQNDYNLTFSNKNEGGPYWSHDGTKIYFTRDLAPPAPHCTGIEIFVYDFISGIETQLTFNDYRENQPVVSPDGNLIVYVKSERPRDNCFVTDLWKMNSDGSNQHYFFGRAWWYDWCRDWGISNNKLLIQWHSESGHWDVALINPDGSNFIRLTETRIMLNLPQAFSPDEQRVLFFSSRGGSLDLWVMDIDGTNLVQITNDPSEKAGADWRSLAVQVKIDIKPGSEPNSINLGSQGNIPVAIFSTETFDATTVDPITVTLAGASVKLKGKGTPMASFEDINGDGFDDIVVHVDTTALELIAGDVEAVLEGETYEGTRIRGVDTVRIVNE